MHWYQRCDRQVRDVELGLRKRYLDRMRIFLVTLWRREGVITSYDSVNSTYQAIKANPGIPRKRISELTGKSISTIDRHIALMAKSNIIEHRDSDETGGY